MMIYTEITPNPAALRFVVDKDLLPTGSLDFPSADTTEDAPLAASLFEFDFTEGVMIGTRFVTVNKKSAFAWEEVIPKVKEVMKDYLENEKPIVTKMPEVPEISAEEEDFVVRKIKQLLEENIRPAVAMDGGDVLFESFEEGVVKLRMQGACSGCPSSTATLKMGIQGLLTRMVPEVKSVEAI